MRHFELVAVPSHCVWERRNGGRKKTEEVGRKKGRGRERGGEKERRKEGRKEGRKGREGKGREVKNLNRGKGVVGYKGHLLLSP